MSNTPINPHEWLLEGLQLHKVGRLGEAEQLYGRILAIDPRNADALHLLGLIDLTFARNETALARLESAVRLRPDYAAFHCDLAIGLRTLNRLEEAMAATRKALQIDPSLAAARFVLATIFQQAGQWEACYQACRQFVEMDPSSLHGLLLLNLSALRTHRLAESIAAGEAAVRLAPEDGSAHWNFALALLASGDFQRGWEHFEWRFRVPKMKPLQRDFAAPIWHKQNITNAVVLLHCEGGFGDAIQFVRYLPQVLDRARQVFLECPRPLYELFALMPGMPGPQTLIVRGDTLPSFDVHCPLQSLPFNFGTTLEQLPSHVPYLRADPVKADHWRDQLAQRPGAAMHVGLIWAGSGNPRDRRSRDIKTFSPLAEIEGIRFVSLQQGPDAAQADEAHGLDLIDPMSRDGDFADTAALIESLDLVISVDTSVAHLAGALGKPIWTLLPHSPDFRWMLGRDDSPWYPTMRLFRQSDSRDWETVMRNVTDGLSQLAR